MVFHLFYFNNLLSTVWHQRKEKPIAHWEHEKVFGSPSCEESLENTPTGLGGGGKEGYGKRGQQKTGWLISDDMDKNSKKQLLMAILVKMMSNRS